MSFKNFPSPKTTRPLSSSEPISAIGAFAIDETAPALDAVLSRLGDRNREISDSELETILDCFRHDRRVHRALIARPVLPEGIVLRLIRLVSSRSDLDDLLLRHASAALATSELRSARPRPGWWREGFVR